MKDHQVRHAIIVVHGSKRDADQYWDTIHGAFENQLKMNNSHVDPQTLIIAPLFYSTTLDKGIYDHKTLAWDDVNVWEAGLPSNHPSNTFISSFAAMESLMYHVSDKSRFPRLQNLTIAGHSGGAQMVGRMVSAFSTLPAVHTRFVVADPSSNAYFTSDRPRVNLTVPSEDCPLYDTWRYGYNGFNETGYDRNETSDVYFQRYVARDVVHLSGLLDVEPNGDQQCMALWQGGVRRIRRNLAWWKYLNLLAGTKEDFSGYPGQFGSLPDWSHLMQGSFQPRLTVVPDMSHDVTIFQHPLGASTLFDTNVIQGWRPGDQPTLDGEDEPAPPNAAGRVSLQPMGLIALVTTASMFLLSN